MESKAIWQIGFKLSLAIREGDGKGLYFCDQCCYTRLVLGPLLFVIHVYDLDVDVQVQVHVYCHVQWHSLNIHK